MKNIFINSIKQISAQQPLTDEWFENPIYYSEPYVRALDPDFKQYLATNTARRLGKLLKRALVVSKKVMEESGVSNPNAIITGTGLGCVESTEIFLNKLVHDGEELLNPTHFMQSTHNTIGSLVAIDTKCHSYNNTYSHKGISFECALQDAFLQLSHTGKPAYSPQDKGAKFFAPTTALVGAHDEMTPAYYYMLKKTGYLDMGLSQFFAGEISVAMMLSTEKSDKSLCKIEKIDKIYGNPMGVNNHSPLQQTDIDFIMVGINGTPENDKIYYENCAKLFPNVPLLQYKHLFGENYTAPALGMYAVALCLQRGKIPEHLKHTTYDLRHTTNFNKILCYNHFENKNHTFILLSK